MISAPRAAGGPNHLLRIFSIWIILSAVCVPLVIWALGPQLPPGSMSAEAHAQTQDNIVLTAVSTPIVLLVFVYFGYALAVFRHRGSAAVLEDGPPLKGDGRTIAAWIVVTFMVVIFLAAWGAYELFPGEFGAGGGQGPNPLAISTPPGAKDALQVQVIGQQWRWTFRYPAYGGVETSQLVIPEGKLVALHVTSLDVIHSFWSHKLAVKADAVPGTDNVAFVTAEATGPIDFRCAELCGLFHGHMTGSGQVMTESGFASWISGQESQWAPATKLLPGYGHVYYPDPQRRAG